MNKTQIAPPGALAATALALLLLFALPSRGQAQEYLWSTLAGSPGVTGAADGKGLAALFSYPDSLAVDAGGTIYVADTFNHTIRKVTAEGVVTTLAGSAGSPGTADGTGSAARFNLPKGITVDASGTVFVADHNSHTIRQVTPGGVVTTLAGKAGVSGFTDGAGDQARFNFPTGLVVDNEGLLYVADADNLRVVGSGATVVTLAGKGGFNGSDDGLRDAARFNLPWGVAVDTNFNLFVADSLNCTLRAVTSRVGQVTTLAGKPLVSGTDDGPAPDARFRNPHGVAVDPAGNIYVADADAHTIRKLTPDGIVSTIGGKPLFTGPTDGKGSAARFNTPSGIAVDAYGILYVADSGSSTIRRGIPLAAARTLTPRVVAVVGQPVTNDATGATYAKLTPAQGPFAGTAKVGTKTVPAVFGGDGSMLLKVGGSVPGSPGTEIVSLGAPSGNSVLAKLKPGLGGVTANDNDVLVTGLIRDGIRIITGRGAALNTPPVAGNTAQVTLDKILTIDGHGLTTFFLAKLKGSSVTAKSDMALCAARVVNIFGTIAPITTMPIREGEDTVAGGPSLKTVGTLVGIKGTLAHGRWRAGDDIFGARLSFNPSRPEALFAGNLSASSFADLSEFLRVGGSVAVNGGTATIKSMALPTCTAGFFGILATLTPTAGVIDSTNDTAIVTESEGPAVILAQEGGFAPDAAGSILGGSRFKAFGSLVTGGQGAAFSATLTGATGAAATGLWQGPDAATLRLIARGGDRAPGGGRFASFTSLVFPGRLEGGVIFTATLAASPAENVTGANKSGLWAVNTNGYLIGLLRTGDQIAGIAGQTRTVKSFRALEPAPGSIGAANGYDDEGHVVALVTFTDGKIALVEFTIP